MLHMKILGFLLLGVFSFFFVELFSVYYATSVGAGYSEIGIIKTAIALLASIVIICTAIIWDKLDSMNK
jgi:hypothetical protein